MSALVFVEHHGAELQKGSLGVLAKAATLGDVSAVLVGGGVRALAPEAARYGAAKGARRRRRFARASASGSRASTSWQRHRGRRVRHRSVANSVLAADIAAGLAARLDAGLNWDLADLELRDGTLVGKRPALQDSVPSTSAGRRRHGSRSSGQARSTPRRRSRSARGRGRLGEYAGHSRSAKVVDHEQEQSSGPSIEDADIIVAGGRGLGAPENFTLAEELARALGGAVGATRAVVDAGWYPYSAQIGQTGKVVSPKLYVRSHLRRDPAQGRHAELECDRRDQQDPNAPIFEFSDLRRRRRRARDRAEAHRAP